MHALNSSVLMPIIGLLDIIVGCVCLFMNACPLVYCWAFVWGFSTAVMRPLAGESVFGLIERTGNSCPALALLWLSSGVHFGYYLTVCSVMIAGLVISGSIFRQTGVLGN